MKPLRNIGMNFGSHIVRKNPTSVTAWQFESNPDYLDQLVIDGVKTATCSGLIFYEMENEPLPSVDGYSIILNSQNEP